MIQAVIGIDVGGTFTKYGIIDRQGNILGEDNIPTDNHEKVEPYVADLAGAIKKMISGLDQEIDLQGVGIGAPNGNFYNGTIEFAPNLQWKGVVPFLDLFRKHFDIPSALTNDANAAAIGEMIFGAAKGMKDFIVITLGTGLGSGIVVNGQLVYGNDGFAGELGHVNVKLRGRDCGCGRKGCLETYVSATGIKRTVFRLLCDRTDKSTLRNVPFEQMTSKMVTEAAEKGDSIALEAFEYTGRILGSKLADTVAHTSPEAIFLFGGLANAGDFIFKPTMQHLEDSLLPIYKNKVKLLPSGLQNTNVAVLGASALIWNELENTK